MKGMVDLSEWRAADRLDPAQLQLSTRRAKTCRGCVFERQWAEVCGEAQAAAARVALKNCESGFIYVLLPGDPLQRPLLEDSHENE
jgi:hypothetical protein